MKKIHCLAILLFPLFLTAQENGLQKENARLRARIDLLESRMDDKFYTRVPNKDFDKQLNDSVDSKVSDYLSGRVALIGTILGIISFALGFLTKYFFSESTRKQIEDSVRKASDDMKNDNSDAQKILNTQIEVQKSFVAENNKLYGERLGDISIRIDNLRNGLTNQLQNYSGTVDKRIGDFEANVKTQVTQLNDQFAGFYGDTKSKIEKVESTQLEFVKSTTELIDKKLNESLGFLWEDVVTAKIERTADLKYTGKGVVESFEALLRRNLPISTELNIKLIDTMMRCYYHTKDDKKDDKKYEKMVSLIKTYEDKYELLPETYVNAAIAFTNNYELYGTADLRETAISNCDKSIKRDRSYGIPYSVKVEIYMIDLLKSRDDAARQGFIKEIDELLYLIKTIDSPLLKGEFLQRLLLDKAVPFLKKYIDELYSIFAIQLAPIRENVIFKLVKNLDKANEWERKMMEDLLSEGLNANPNIDGKWHCIDCMDAGNNLEAEAGVSMELKNSVYTFFEKDAVVETGYVFYPPHIKPYTLSLIAVRGNNTDTITRGIYQKKEDGTLELCLSEPSKERPVSFLSDAVNKNKLITFAVSA
jgi:uncharacterized protein (TIGR03067 family)